ncbi:MAG: hypothetical protein HZB76_04065 [Chlamydiae bacterium]|nr:hypothetical protein [Chlamydiota bacterium]
MAHLIINPLQETPFEKPRLETQSLEAANVLATIDRMRLPANSALGTLVKTFLETFAYYEVNSALEKMSVQVDFKKLYHTQQIGQITESALKSIYQEDPLINAVTFRDLKQQQVDNNLNLIKIIPGIISALPQNLQQELTLILNNADLKLNDKAAAIRAWLNNHLAIIQQINRLSLRNLGLTIVPEELNLFSGITWLDLGGNQLSKLAPNFLINADHLENLYLDRNHLTELHPNFLINANHLRELLLTGNQLRDLPPNFLINAHHLVMLSLSDNRLRDLPPNFLINANALQTLYLDTNLLTDLPLNFLVNSNNLEEFGLSCNHLRDLHPNFLINANNLKDLNLTSNQLRELPLNFLINANNLRDLALGKNPLRDLPQSILNNPNRPQLLQLYVSPLTAGELPPNRLNPLIQMHICQEQHL